MSLPLAVLQVLCLTTGLAPSPSTSIGLEAARGPGEQQPADRAPVADPPAPPLEAHDLFAAGLEYGGPYKLAGSLRYEVSVSRGSYSGGAFLLQSVGSVGLGGAKVGAGLGFDGGDSLPGLFTARATLAQTFGHPLGLAADRAWWGAEVEWSLYHFLSAQAGVLRPFGGGDTAFTWSVGIGLPLINWGEAACAMAPGSCH
jgi:hypothetical protein